MTMEKHLELQKKYLSESDEEKYQCLRYHADDLYSKNLVNYLLSYGGISKQDKILELGAGAGRFTIHLVKAGFDVTCVDFSKILIRLLQEDAKKASIPTNKLKIHYACIENITTDLNDCYDAIIGFYILHHLDLNNIGSYFSKFRKLLKPNGKICFLEPNRLNPLFLLQYVFQKNINFWCEMGTFKLSKGLIKKALLSTWYNGIAFKNFGFFPPQIINHLPFLFKFEKCVEKISIFNKLLPFLLIIAESTNETY